MNINNDLESQRIQRNLTKTQIKTSNLVKEGVLVNSNMPLSDSYNTMVIADSVNLPDKLYEKNTKKEKRLIPICATTVGTMGAITGITKLFEKSAKDSINVDLAKKLPSLTRNVCINEEINQAIYRMVASPSKKATRAAVGVAVLGSMGFIGKTFCDGFKEVWVKKKEADIQKNLQENLIAVETQTFGGKLQINRNMLAVKAKEFSKALNDENELNENFKSAKINFRNKQSQNNVFLTVQHKKNQNVSFKKNNDKSNKKNSFLKNLGYIGIGLVSLGAIVGLGYASIKNIRKANQYMKDGVNKVRESIDTIITKMKDHTSENHAAEILGEGYNSAKELNHSNIKNLLVAIDASPDEVIKTAEKMPWKDAKDKQQFIEDTIFSIKKSTEKANSALGGSGEDRNTFYSHVSNYTAFFYNWLLDSSNKQFKNLFFGITGATAAGYIGETACNAVKEVQVKKYNADTELSLQKRLVSTELKNFKSKKEASINPLSDEFYKQKREGKSKEELKIVADSILNEIKNGAPYVYS